MRERNEKKLGRKRMEFVCIGGTDRKIIGRCEEVNEGGTDEIRER